MKFPLAQEVSRHVRDKLCKFYSSGNALQSPATSTVTSKAFVSTTSHSTTFQGLENEKVNESPSRLASDLIESNITDILSPTSFDIKLGSDHEFGLIIEQIEQEAEVSFTCKVCDFR